MQLEDYFEFLDPDDIRIKCIIALSIDAYMLRLAKWREQHYQESLANPSHDGKTAKGSLKVLWI